MGMARGWVLAVSTFAAAAGAGCRSVEGRYIDPECLAHGQEVGGAPIVVERPRWLMVTHKEQILALVAETTRTENNVKTVSHEVLKVDAPAGGTALGARTLTRQSVETEVLTMGEMYALDFLRPFAGSSDHALEWNDDRSHPKKITQKVDDKTLDSILSNLDKIKDFVGAAGPPPDTTIKGAGTVVVGERVTRIELYDLYDLARGVVRAVWATEAGVGPSCAPPCPPPPPPPPPCSPRAR